MCHFPFVVRDRSVEHDPELGLLAPVPSAAGEDGVHLEPSDGRFPLSFHCTRLTLRVAGGQRLLRAHDLRVRAMLTDSRLVFACSAFDPGGRRLGAGASLALNQSRKVLAAGHCEDRMLVGHLRFPWISAVYARNDHGIFSSEQLRVFFVDEGVRTQLDLELDCGSDAPAVATELLRRIGRFRLHHEPDLALGEQLEFEALARLEPLVDDPRSEEMPGRRLSTCWPAGEHSARFGQGAEVGGDVVVTLR